VLKKTLKHKCRNLGKWTFRSGTSYGIYQDIEDETIFKLISEWNTRKHANSHLSSDQFGVLLGSRILLSKPVEVQICTVSQVEGIKAVRSARENKDENHGTGQ
jgi:hypothetical protein